MNEAANSRRNCYDKPVWTVGELLRVLPQMPSHTKNVLPTVFGRPISSELREKVMLAVTARNKCRYCRIAHTAIGKAVGVTQAEIDAVVGEARPLSNSNEEHAVRFARDLAERDFKSQDEQMYENLSEIFSEEELATIESSAHLINFANRFGNTFDAAVNRLLGKCTETEAGALDMAVVSALFVPVALAMSPVVGGVMLHNRRNKK